MDHETILNSVKKTNRLVILEEAWPFGNVATEITFQRFYRQVRKL